MKLAVLIFIGVVAVAQGAIIGLICTPGSLFKIQCNHCFCSSTGRNYGCTKMGCGGVRDFDELQNGIDDITPLTSYDKREVIYENSRKKRATDNIYETDQHFFIDDDPAPLSYEQQQELARQSYLQQQQDYYDKLQFQQDLAREKEELEQQQEELEQQMEELQGQLEFQQEQDAQQWEEDARQMALERQQLLLEQQRELVEQQQQQKQDEQYYKKVRNYGRKMPFKSINPE